MDGDPATFNGLAEEALACHKAGIGFEVVPGVSAVSAVPAYAGDPADLEHVAGGARRQRQRPQGRLVRVGRRPRDRGAARRAGRPRRGPRRAARRRPLRGHPGRPHRARHDDRQRHPHQHPGRGRQGHEERRVPGAGRGRLDGRPCASSCPGSRPSRCSAGASWCRAPRSRPARIIRPPARPTARPPEVVPTISRRAAAHAAADGARDQGPGRPAATSGSASPRSTPSRPCGRSSRSTASTPGPSPA